VRQKNELAALAVAATWLQVRSSGRSSAVMSCRWASSRWVVSEAAARHDELSIG